MTDRRNPFAAALAAVLVLAAPAAAGAAERRRMGPDDLPRIVRLNDPQIAPDGRSVALVLARANLKEDRYDTELVLVDVAARALRPLTHDRLGVAAPRWSPAGDRIAFLAEDAAKKAQLFVIAVNGGDARQVTRSKTPVTVFAWKPDGSGFAYAAADEEAERKDEAKFEDAFEVGNNGYLERARAQPVHLWTIGADGGEARRVTRGDWSLPRSLAPSGPPSEPVWTRDGRSLVFARAASPLTGDGVSARLAIADVATGEVRALGAADARQARPVLSPDGRGVAYAFPEDGRMGSAEAVWAAPLEGGPAVNLTSGLDRDLQLIGFTGDGRAALVEGADGSGTALWLQTLGGRARRLPLGGEPLTPQGASLAPGGAIAFAATRPDAPAELYFLAGPDARPVQLTHLQALAEELETGRQETIRWTSDGQEVNGVLTYPPGWRPGGPLPLVLYIHGGPVATSLETFTSSAQILAAQGWLVFEPNYRGSDNAGNAFQRAIHGHGSSAPGRDIVAGVEALKARGLVDPRRMAVSGWSYGGQMTTWLLGAYPDLWVAGVAGAPVTDLVDQYTLSDNNVARGVAYGPSPFVGDNLKSYAAESPISLAWRVRAPTLIMSDVGDWRVTTTQAYKFFHALKDNGVDVRFIAYPVPGHSPADPIRARDVWRRWIAWLKPRLEAPAAAAAD